MKKTLFTLAVLFAATSHATVVQRQYTASISHYASANDEVVIGSTVIREGDKLTGVFSYDDAMEASRSGLPLFHSYEYGYFGSVQNNHITLALNGAPLVLAPAVDMPECSLPSFLCPGLPLVMERSAGPDWMGKSTDILTLHYIAPAPFPELITYDRPARVASISLSFFYPTELAGSALPQDIRLADLRFAQMTLNLSDRSGVFAFVDSISPVPETGTSAMAVVGLGLIGVLASRRRTKR